MEINQGVKSEYDKLKESRFKQQKLPAWRPVPSIVCTILIFLGFGIVFIIIGAVVLSYSKEIFEYTSEYSETCQENPNCTISINITETINPPIMFYYQLNNFYQNHRRYVKSKSNSQLLGQLLTVDSIKTDCDPIVTNADMGKTKSIGNYDLVATEPANPCGLIAKSFFNDTYVLKDPQGIKVNINDTGIAWQADLDLKYKLPADLEQAKKVLWKNYTDEHFVVWMRPAGLPDFRKLWGRIQQKLTPGMYKLEVDNIYSYKIFNGKKSIVLSTVNAFGGKNTFLGISYIVVGSICILMALGFFIGDKVQKKKNQ